MCLLIRSCRKNPRSDITKIIGMLKINYARSMNILIYIVLIFTFIFKSHFFNIIIFFNADDRRNMGQQFTGHNPGMYHLNLMFYMACKIFTNRFQ